MAAQHAGDADANRETVRKRLNRFLALRSNGGSCLGYFNVVDPDSEREERAGFYELSIVYRAFRRWNVNISDATQSEIEAMLRNASLGRLNPTADPNPCMIPRVPAEAEPQPVVLVASSAEQADRGR